jgi:hypothetical protein
MDPKIKNPKQPSEEQLMIAAVLLDLSGNAFTITPKKNSSYISLDVQIGKSKNNKNAVSVSRHRVSFMVSDWKAVEDANRLRIPIAVDEEHTKLQFPELTTSVIINNAAFFQGLLANARSKAIYNQEH